MEDEKNILHGGEFAVESFGNVSVGQVILDRLKMHGSQIAEIDAYTGEVSNFKQILDESRKLAIYLKRAGLQVNERIAISSENNIYYSTPLCAALYLGATVCPLNPFYTEKELKHVLNLTKPKYIFVSTVSRETVQKTISQLDWAVQLVMLTKSNVTGLPNMRNWISSVSDDAMNSFQACSVDINNHIALVLCSSGTTGLPKGVKIMDKNILTCFRYFTDPVAVEILKSQKILTLLPFFHVYSLMILFCRLLAGTSTVLLARFEEKLFLQTIEKYKITGLQLVPPLMVFLAKHPLVDKYDLSTVQIIWCGAASLSKEIQKAVAERLNVPHILQGYGMTETTFSVTSSVPGMEKDGSIGILRQGISAKVIAIDGPDKGKALGPNCAGEMCFKGDSITRGYLNDEKSTEMLIDKDGWLHSGDIGYYDEDGYFYIVDRLKDLIKYKAFQVPPAELETILLSCPGIKDAVVVGLPDEEAGELPLAFVVKQDGSNITEQEIIQYVKVRVSNPKQLRGGVRFVKEIPKTSSGKPLRRMLRDSLKSKL